MIRIPLCFDRLTRLIHFNLLCAVHKSIRTNEQFI
jgi:hypothetical protein